MKMKKKNKSNKNKLNKDKLGTGWVVLLWNWNSGRWCLVENMIYDTKDTALFVAAGYGYGCKYSVKKIKIPKAPKPPVISGSDRNAVLYCDD